MHTRIRVLATMSLLLGVAACGGSSAPEAGGVPVTAPVRVSACPGAGGTFALDRTTGAERWHRCTTDGVSGQLVEVTDDTVYVAETAWESATLLALDVTDGRERWQIPIPVMNESFHLDALYAAANGSFTGGGIIFLDILDNVAARSEHVGYDATTGEETVRIPADDRLVVLDTDDLVVTGPGFAGDLVGTGPTASLQAFDRTTGELRWSNDELTFFAAPWGAHRAGDSVALPQYADAAPHGVAVVDLGSGAIRWRNDDGFVLLDADEDIVLGLDSLTPGPDAHLIALDRSDGHELWRTAAADTMGANVLVDGAAVVASGGSVVVLDTDDGSETWRRDVDASVSDAGSGLVAVHAPNGATVELLDPRTGSMRVRVEGDVGWDGTVTATGDLVTIQAYAPAGAGAAEGDESSEQEQAPGVGSTRCSDGDPLGGQSMGQDGKMYYVLRSGADDAFCVFDPDGREDVVEVTPGADVAAPEATVIHGVLGVYLHLVVPASWGAVPSVVDPSGRRFMTYGLPNGIDVLVLDIGDPSIPDGAYVPTTFRLVGSDGTELGSVTVAAPPSLSSSEAAACFTANGIHVSTVTMGNGTMLRVDDPQPLDEQLTKEAWAACGSLLTSGITGADALAAVEKTACLAGYGFLDMFIPTERDPALFAAAATQCSNDPLRLTVGLTCDVYLVDQNGAITGEPVRSGVTGFSMVAAAVAPEHATVGEPFTITIPSSTTGLFRTTAGFEVIEHRDLVRTFTVAGATVVPDSAMSEFSGQTIFVTDTTVSLGWPGPVAGGGEVTFPEAHFDVVPVSPGEVTVTMSHYDSTLLLRGTDDSSETTVRTVCTGSDDVLARTTVD